MILLLDKNEYNPDDNSNPKHILIQNVPDDSNPEMIQKQQNYSMITFQIDMERQKYLIDDYSFKIMDSE